MSNIKNLSKAAQQSYAIEPASQTTQSQYHKADGRAGRLALSQELRGVDLGALSRALSSSSDDACALCASFDGVATAQPESAESEQIRDASLPTPPDARSAESNAAIEETAFADKSHDAQTSGTPNDEQVIDEMVQKLNEDDAAEQQSKDAGGPSADPQNAGGSGAGGGAANGGGDAQAVVQAASHVRTATTAPAAADTDAYTIVVNGKAVHDGETIPGSFRPDSSWGSAMAHGGHSLNTCVFGHAGTNSWAKPSGFPGTLGLTTVTNAFSGPKFDIETSQRQKVTGPPSVGGFLRWATGTGPTEWVAKVKATTSADATHPCVSSPAGEHKTGTKMVNVKGTPTAYDTFMNITAAYAGKIWAAEDEHLADCLRAYTICLKRAEDEVNKLTTGQWVADAEADAKAGAEGALRTAMPAKLGIDPTTWRTAVWQLCLMTISGRDNLGWHTFTSTEQSPDHGAKKVVSTLSDGTTNIGSVPSTTVVDLSKLP